MKHIRESYGVPAYIRGRVFLDGRPGTITGSWGAKLLIMLDGECWSRLIEPDGVEYTGERKSRIGTVLRKALRKPEGYGPSGYGKTNGMDRRATDQTRFVL